MKGLAIFGSRTLDEKSFKKIIQKEIEALDPEYILTAGDAEGICALVRELCEEIKIPIKVFYADNKKYAAGKYHHRSVFVLKECDYCVFLHDGKSEGTRNEIEVADKLKVEYKYIELKPIIKIKWNKDYMVTLGEAKPRLEDFI